MISYGLPTYAIQLSGHGFNTKVACEYLMIICSHAGADLEEGVRGVPLPLHSPASYMQTHSQ